MEGEYFEAMFLKQYRQVACFMCEVVDEARETLQNPIKKLNFDLFVGASVFLRNAL